MQISRHWRMNSQRYRLDGIRKANQEKAQPTTQEVRTEAAPQPLTVRAHDGVAAR
jgi:hypothetical protein